MCNDNKEKYKNVNLNINRFLDYFVMYYLGCYMYLFVERIMR